LRSDVLVHLDLFVAEGERPGSWLKNGEFWGSCVFFDADSLNAPALENEDDFETDDALKTYCLGGVWVKWKTPASYQAGDAGMVEYISAGTGFGPDILELAASYFDRPLRLGRGWASSQTLFARYPGGIVLPGVPKRLRLVPKRFADADVFDSGRSEVQGTALLSFESRDESVGILPRYQQPNDRYSVNMAAIEADTEQLQRNPRLSARRYK
jgi:hypothetical protein